ncbi:hypothetical protein FB451DRAFT_1275033 [Mycena latifolia]|nr:hypothetical protein FB451DRAFT_1275033 [Mycena latifolia]
MVRIMSVLLAATVLASTNAVPTGSSEARAPVSPVGTVHAMPRELEGRAFAISDPQPTKEGLKRRQFPFALAGKEPTKADLEAGEASASAISEPESSKENL